MPQTKLPNEIHARSVAYPRDGGCLNPAWRYVDEAHTDVRKTMDAERQRLAAQKRKAPKALRAIS